MSVKIGGVCRRRLRDSIDSLLDKLTREIHPEGLDSEIVDRKEEVEIPEDKIEESSEEKKKRMVEEGKLKAEVKHEVEKYKEKLMGNSRLLHDASGKIKKR
jgi:hypothetical protein